MFGTYRIWGDVLGHTDVGGCTDMQGAHRCIGCTDVWGHIVMGDVWGVYKCTGGIQMYGAYRCMGPYRQMENV